MTLEKRATDRLAVQAHRVTAVRALPAEAGLVGVLAHVRLVALATRASATKSLRHDYPIAGFDLANAGSRFFDNARTFMAEHRRQRYNATVLRVRMADAAGFDPYENFAVPKTVEFDIFQRDNALGLSDDCGGSGDHHLHLK